MARYLVTGGAGFIGSHLAEALLGQGQEVVVLDNLASGRESNITPWLKLRRFTFIKDDVRDSGACRRALAGVDYVLHQAARPSVPRSLEDPFLSHDINVSGSLSLLLAAREAGVKRVVLASSSSVYGNREKEEEAKREDMDLRPLSPYAASKAAMEHYARAFYRSFQLETVCLRYFNVFGPRQDPHSAYAAVIPSFLFALLQGQRPVIFGNGRQSRDFTHVANVVAANLAACQAPGAAGGVFNVAAGKAHNLLDLFSILRANLGCSDLEPLFASPRAGDVSHSLADISRAQEILGYKTEVGFAEGLAGLCRLARDEQYFCPTCRK
ncbi:MAG: NAD-dependent epimerase/dehydratase family protein [Desulfarculales bacterium]|nr:NAD-dependent epimerase/dehydratase family protein [Desulfarculales bacterium]